MFPKKATKLWKPDKKNPEQYFIEPKLIFDLSAKKDNESDIDALAEDIYEDIKPNKWITLKSEFDKENYSNTDIKALDSVLEQLTKRLNFIINIENAHKASNLGKDKGKGCHITGILDVASPGYYEKVIKKNMQYKVLVQDPNFHVTTFTEPLEQGDMVGHKINILVQAADVGKLDMYWYEKTNKPYDDNMQNNAWAPMHNRDSSYLEPWGDRNGKNVLITDEPAVKKNSVKHDPRKLLIRVIIRNRETKQVVMVCADQVLGPLLESNQLKKALKTEIEHNLKAINEFVSENLGDWETVIEIGEDFNQVAQENANLNVKK